MTKSPRHNRSEIARLLRDAEAMLATDKTVADACRALGVSKQTFHRWRAKQRSASFGETGRSQELEAENCRLRRIVADQALRIQTLVDAEKCRH